MTFISYAQNLEDVMLWRALNHISEGFYIDVGANDPHEDSVTKAFYLRGWRGINIEPLSSHINALNQERAHDINLQCAAGNSGGTLQLWETDIRGWATADSEVIKKHISEGHSGIFHEVPVRTLANICEEFCAEQIIHFLKIDVEGLEKTVLQSNNWANFRPWIVVVEATQPNSTISTHLEWEYILIESKYLFAYADGLNRFYVAQEHHELLPALVYPPNVFDVFIKENEHRLIEHANTLWSELNTIKNNYALLESKLIEVQNQTSKTSDLLRDTDQATIYLDISELVGTDHGSGIHRVMRSIMSAMNNLKSGYTITPIYSPPPFEDTFYAASSLIKNEKNQEDYVIDFRDGDILLYLDFCVVNAANKKLKNQQLMSQGVKVYFMVYDILPIIFPEMFWQGIKPLFEKWLDSALHSNGVICISQTVAQEFISWAQPMYQQQITANNFKVQYFHLGADISNSVPSKGLPNNAKQILKAIQSKISFLMVGTMEPRKGHEQTLKAFEALWAQGIDVNLVVVGRNGWNTSSLIDKIQSHIEFSRRLFWLNEASDEYLEAIYHSSACLIAASYGEGFGLPLIEAAQKQLPIIARNIPVFKEVAGDFAYYFDGLTAEDLSNAIKTWLILHQQGTAPQSIDMPWITWQESTQNLLNCIIPN